MILEEAFHRVGLNNWELEARSEWFDVRGNTPTDGARRQLEYNCDQIPCCLVVSLYARLGLHRYNLINEINFQLSRVNKYTRDTGTAACDYFITLDATWCCSPVTFEAQVLEENFSELDLTSLIARPLGTEEPVPYGYHKPVDDFYLGSLPKWPSKEYAFTDTNQFYLVNKSDLGDNDWIHLYFVLAVAITERPAKEHYLSRLKILNVAIETKEAVEPPNERLNAKNAIVYIKYYMDQLNDQDSEHVCRTAIVRRSVDEREGCFRLVGKTSRDIIPKEIKLKNPNLPLLFRRRLGFHKLWQLSSPRFQAFKKRGALARRPNAYQSF